MGVGYRHLLQFAQGVRDSWPVEKVNTRIAVELRELVIPVLGGEPHNGNSDRKSQVQLWTGGDLGSHVFQRFQKATELGDGSQKIAVDADLGSQDKLTVAPELVALAVKKSPDGP